ncbi:uncharacterized protein LOC18448894 [Amborella trichopoda]|uniref:AtTam37 zinc finger domain-containing protein n=1 Tax=Amborella trichopoda TaxID=13333 RepID=U5DIR5_AMBTC|nr:uncharacterized protein LOC18448894 [Amborella trichopoda]ERN20478.1 hypothetical protein AMTR_s00068p00160530 [Amborella trichopoda]|eukprot:XP_006859011.1 uncharacterized protein LOC18448894 [Amborella trichopoda]
MARGTERLAKLIKQNADFYGKIFKDHFAPPLMGLIELPYRVLISPFTLAADIVGSAPRGFGVPEFISHLSFSAIFAVATLGTYDIALELGKKVLCQRNCGTCSGWQALRCTMCKGTGKVQYQVKNYTLKSGQRPTPESVAEAIADNRAELVHLPSAIDLDLPLPTKECPSCDGSGVMSCPECKNKLQVRISADDIMEPPWKAYNVFRKMEYPYEHIADSMRDPNIAAFWLISMPEIMGGFTFDDDAKKKIWWAYKESMRYDQLRDIVAKRKPGWEHLQQALVSIDPERARDDPVIVKNIPYYKAKKALEAEVTKLDVPPRPDNWGDLKLPLTKTSWTDEELKDPQKLLEMTTLLTAQREMADKFLDTQWETKWRQDKLNELLEEKVRPYIKSVDTGVLPQPIIMKPQDQEAKESRRRRRWLFF